MTTIEEVRDFFQADRFAMEMGAHIVEARTGYSQIRLQAQQTHLNAGGFVQGGAIFTLADFAFAVAANVGQPFTVSLANQITYLKACRAGLLTAEAREISATRSTCFYTVSVYDGAGAHVAEMTVNGFRKQPRE